VTSAKAVEVQPEEDDLALERQVCFALALASRGVIAVYRPLLEPMGLTHPQYLVMLALWQHEPLTVKAVSELLQLEPATVSLMLKRLESSGLIRRQRDPEDERTLRVTLTPKGRELRREALKIPAAIMQRLGIQRAEVESLHAMLTNVITLAHTANSPSLNGIAASVT
jgi:MarR family transcriptional regulator, organic hydroperoxide resistance regulator